MLEFQTWTLRKQMCFPSYRVWDEVENLNNLCILQNITWATWAKGLATLSLGENLAWSPSFTSQLNPYRKKCGSKSSYFNLFILVCWQKTELFFSPPPECSHNYQISQREKSVVLDTISDIVGCKAWANIFGKSVFLTWNLCSDQLSKPVLLNRNIMWATQVIKNFPVASLEKAERNLALILRTQSKPVAHSCNPSYLRSIDQEDGGLKPA
jgi:hypothetical protein